MSATGILRYPRITEADTTGKYADGKFKTQLLVPKKDAQKLVDELKEIAKNNPDLKALKADIKFPFKPDKDDEDIVVFVMKSKFKPLIFDGSRKEVKNLKERLAGGSTVRIAGTVFAYDKGLSLQMKQVQVLELRSGAESMFDEAEGSFDASEYDSSDAPKTFGGADEAGDSDGPDI
jgi:hypothetical protein